MTQSLLFPAYLIDTDVLFWLDGVNTEKNGSLRYSTLERGLIWDGLDQLARDGCLMLIPQIRGELGDLYAGGLARLRTLHGLRTLRQNNRVILKYQEVMAKYPNWVSEHVQRDPGDPWLIAFASQFGYTILTEEKSASAQRMPQPRPKIPDVCAELGLACTTLRALADERGWLKQTS